MTMITRRTLALGLGTASLARTFLARRTRAGNPLEIRALDGTIVREIDPLDRAIWLEGEGTR